MKKLDKLILSSFIGPFILTFIVVVFILLNQHMLKYFNDIIGKNLGLDVVGLLFFYFAVFMMPMAMPLAVLLSSLITFSNLGENYELTAIKSLGVSLARSLSSLFVFVIFIVLIAFCINNYLVPKAALEAYSLLYDIKQKKPALELREGIFYDAIPKISIKANHKFPDGQTLKGIIIYDHRKEGGDSHVTVADSGKMLTVFNGQYLKLELFNGYNYSESSIQKKKQNNYNQVVPTMTKTSFSNTEILFDLSSFGLTRTDKKWFRGHRIMHNLVELQRDVDSLGDQLMGERLRAFNSMQNNFMTYYNRDNTISLPPDLQGYKKRKDSIQRISLNKNEMDRGKLKLAESTPVESPKTNPVKITLSPSVQSKYDATFSAKATQEEVNRALEKARKIKERILSYTVPIVDDMLELRTFQVQWHKILASSFACLSMFLIGAPLGTIIRKGGLGIPVIISIFLFIVFYILTIMGEKWGKNGILPPFAGAWMANGVLLLIGFFFLSRAKADTRLLDMDLYNVTWDKLKGYFKSWKNRTI